jgi:AraC-like DNA-binding protein
VDDYFAGLNQYYFNWIRIFYITYPGASLLGLYLLLKGNENLEHTSEPLLVGVFFLLSGIFFLIAYIANHQRYIENGEFYRNTSFDTSNPNSTPQIPAGLKMALAQLFEEDRPFLEHELKITDIASRLGTNRTYISHLIRVDYQTNFSGFVNTFRVREAIRLFSQEAYRNHTTKSISEAAGFNNYNSFTEAFRKTTGMTPGKYREKINNGSSNQS